MGSATALAKARVVIVLAGVAAAQASGAQRPPTSGCYTQSGVEISAQLSVTCARLGGRWIEPADRLPPPTAPLPTPPSSAEGYLFEAVDRVASACVAISHVDEADVLRSSARRHGGDCRASTGRDGVVRVNCRGARPVVIIAAPSQEQCNRLRSDFAAPLDR